MTEEAPQAEGQAQDAPESQGQANETKAWYESSEGITPEDVGYIQNKGWQEDPFKAVKSYQELEKFRGADEKSLIKLPKDFDEEGALDPIYDRLGRPESADKYEIKLPEGIPIDEARLSAFKEAAHKLGLNNKQAAALADLDVQYTLQHLEKSNAEEKQKQEAEYEALKKEWGSNAAEREELSRRGLRAVLPKGANADEIIGKIEQAIGTAAVLKMFANVGDRLTREDKVHDSSGDRPFGYTREQAAADKAALMSEIKADAGRLAAYNKVVGSDYDKMARINKILAS